MRYVAGTQQNRGIPGKIPVTVIPIGGHLFHSNATAATFS